MTPVIYAVSMLERLFAADPHHVVPICVVTDAEVEGLWELLGISTKDTPIRMENIRSYAASCGGIGLAKSDMREVVGAEIANFITETCNEDQVWRALAILLSIVYPGATDSYRYARGLNKLVLNWWMKPDVENREMGKEGDYRQGLDAEGAKHLHQIFLGHTSSFVGEANPSVLEMFVSSLHIMWAARSVS